MNRRPRKSSAKQPAKSPALTGYRLTEALVAGWRPLQRLDVAGFALLRSRGFTRRANSAVAIDAPDDHDALLAAVERVEGLCAMTGDAACFRVLSTHGPAGLDALLAERGYAVEAESELLERPLDEQAFSPHPDAEIRVGTLDEDWFRAAWELAPRGDDDVREAMRAIVAATPAVQVLLRSEETGEALAVGRAALGEAGKQDVAVLNVIRVHDDHRRRGLGRAVSETVLAAAAAQGVGRAVLEVERDNTAALALYRGLGFEHLGDYHYRVAPRPGASS